MCGIICLISKKIKEDDIIKSLEILKARGPDARSYKIINEENKEIYFGFTRLSIMDTSINGLQPFTMGKKMIICNGEIYNYKDLIIKYKLEDTECDCRILLPLIEKIGFNHMINEIDAEFAMIYYDGNSIYAARDRYGVRPLYYGFKDEMIGFASELKVLHQLMNTIEQVKPNEIFKINNDIKREIYYDYDKLTYNENMNNIIYIHNELRRTLINAVNKRLHADRPIGFLLSGGLDSSLIVSIATNILGIENITCFSIGIEGSPDIEAAKKVVKYLRIKNHYIVPFSVEIGLKELEKVIEVIETYDITTIRASVAQYIMAKFINEKTDIKVILSGEGSDEIAGGYKYMRNAPNKEEFHKETIKLLKELYFYDNKRTDRTMAGNGLEVRIPFLDKEYVEFITKIDPKLLMYKKDYIEKRILRDAFKGFLPDEILYRPKEAFSDAVSSKEINWYKSIQEKVEKIITNDELINNPFKINKPEIKEALYYRRIFNKIYPNRDDIIPHYWLPNFQNEKIIDPSATVLKN